MRFTELPAYVIIELFVSVAETSYQMERSGGPPSEFSTEHASISLLREVVDIDMLSAHLRVFADRPWPTHSLSDRIVDQEYIPIVTDPPTAEAWIMEIRSDRKIAVNGKATSFYKGVSLKLLNLLFLTCDQRLTSRDFVTLGLAEYGEVLKNDPHFYNSYLDSQTHTYRAARQRLQEKVAPYNLFDRPKLDAYTSYRINPSMRLVDRRINNP